MTWAAAVTSFPIGEPRETVTGAPTPIHLFSDRDVTEALPLSSFSPRSAWHRKCPSGLLLEDVYEPFQVFSSAVWCQTVKVSFLFA